MAGEPTDPPAPRGAIGKGLDKIAAPVAALTGVMDGLRKSTDALVEPFEKATKATEGLVKAFGGKGGFKGFIESATEIDAMRASLEKLTGQGDKYTKMAVGLQAKMTQFGISNKEAKDSVSTLVAGFAEFTQMSPKAQEEIAKQTLGMTKLGISIAESTTNWDLMIKGMGMSQKEAKKTTNDIAKLAKAIGVPPKQMAKDFAASMPHLSRYGKAGVKVFNELAVQSKATGLSMSSLLKVAQGFDTFEDAADKAGRLNAMLGGNLINSMDMLTATESERIDMIRQGMQATGQSWDMLDRFQKKGIAAAAGIGSMSDAMKLFGTEQASLDSLKEKADPAIVAQQNLTAAMHKGTSIAEKFVAAFDKLGNIVGRTLMPIMRRLANFFTGKDGLGAVEHVFRKISDGIEGMFNWWTKLHPETKTLIKDFAAMAIQVAAVSFAVMQAQSVVAPFFQLLSSPWGLIIGGLIAVVTHWGKLNVLWAKTTKVFKVLDGMVMRFFDRHKGSDFLQGVKKYYVLLRDGIKPLLKDLSSWFETNQPVIEAYFNTFIKGPLKLLWKQFETSTGIFQGGVGAMIGRMVGKVMEFFSTMKEMFFGLMARIYSALAAPGTSAINPIAIAHRKAMGMTISDVREMQEKAEAAKMKSKGYSDISVGAIRRRNYLETTIAEKQDAWKSLGSSKEDIAKSKVLSKQLKHWRAELDKLKSTVFTKRQQAADTGVANFMAQIPSTAPTVTPPTSAAVSAAQPEREITTNINLCLEADGMKKEIGQIAVSAVEERMNPNETQRLSVPPMMSVWTPT